MLSKLLYSASLLGLFLFPSSIHGLMWLHPYRLFEVDSTCTRADIERDFVDASIMFDNTARAISELQEMRAFTRARRGGPVEEIQRTWDHAAMTFGLELMATYQVMGSVNTWSWTWGASTCCQSVDVAGARRVTRRSLKNPWSSSSRVVLTLLQ